MGEIWRVDRTASVSFCKAAAAAEPSQAKREWNGFLSLAFADVDSAKTGMINPDQFDELCEQVARLPRRFGLAPSWGTSMEVARTRGLQHARRCPMLIPCTDQ